MTDINITDTTDVPEREIPRPLEAELTERSRTMISRMHRLAVWLEDHPTFANEFYFSAFPTVYAYEPEHFVQLCDELGSFTKADQYDDLVAQKDIGDDLLVKVRISKTATCEKVLVGTKDVIVESVPEGVEMVKTVEKKPVYEYKCPDVWSQIGKPAR